MDYGLLGGIIGSAFGLAGGVFGTYHSIKNTRGPMERGFMIRAALVVWLALLLFLAGLLILPDAFRPFLWGIWGVLLVWGILFINRRQERIRRQEAAGSGQ